MKTKIDKAHYHQGLKIEKSLKICYLMKRYSSKPNYLPKKVTIIHQINIKDSQESV